MSLYEELKASFPEENVEPFGSCLIIPENVFEKEWENQLKQEGLQVFSQSYNGRVCFFVRKPLNTVNRENKLGEKRRGWSEEEKQRLLKLRDEEGLGWTQIGRIFGKTRQCVYRMYKRIKGLDKNSQNKNSEKMFDGKHEDKLKMLIESLSLLYTHGYKQLCVFLLENSEKFLGEQP